MLEIIGGTLFGVIFILMGPKIFSRSRWTSWASCATGTLFLLGAMIEFHIRFIQFSWPVVCAEVGFFVFVVVFLTEGSINAAEDWGD